MNSPFEASEEEKKLLEEIWNLKQQIKSLKEDRYFLGKEKSGHTRVSKTELVPAIIFTVLCLFNVLLLVFEILIGLGTLSFKEDSFLDKDTMFNLSMAISFTVGTPVLAIFFGIMAFINYRKLYYQTSKFTSTKEKAEELGFTNYHTESERIDNSYDNTSAKLFHLETRLKEAEEELEVLQTKRAIEERKASENKPKEDVKLEIIKHESNYPDSFSSQ